MHKTMLKFFGFLDSAVQFFKILTVFCMMCLLMLWANNLAHFGWEWLNFIAPLLNSLLEIGAYINDESLDIFGTLFEYKYPITFVILCVVYLGSEYAQKFVKKLENLYLDIRKKVRKAEENAYNQVIKTEMSFEQEQIKKYQIYISATMKKRRSLGMNYFNTEEAIESMNKFLAENTGVTPIKYGEGFLYSYENFDEIDKVLPNYFKILKTELPMDYIICVQVMPKFANKEIENLKQLINLKFYNKISTFADTVWRYKFNQNKRYNFSQLGIYQSGEGTLEAQEFIE